MLPTSMNQKEDLQTIFITCFHNIKESKLNFKRYYENRFIIRYTRMVSHSFIVQHNLKIYQKFLLESIP